MTNKVLGQPGKYDLHTLHEIEDQKQLFDVFENPHKDVQ